MRPPSSELARVDLAAALLMAERLGLHEGVCNHFSTKVAGPDQRYLINPMGRHWAEMRASDLLAVDGAGHVVEGRGMVETTAFHIHAALHRTRPDAIAVLHTHMPYATALSLIDGDGLLPCYQNALRFQGAVAWDEAYGGLALDDHEGERMARAIGTKRILMLANHGVIVIGRSVAEAFDDLYYFERAAQVQILAMSTGRRLRLIDPEVAARTAEAFERDREAGATYHFEALKRLLDGEIPGWRV
jgi:ribulose-5-phosphate 4-epimerase/fuculose-1-phosphate aldolase